MTNDPTDTAISAYARVFSAMSDEPLSAKSIATATGLPYKDVSAHLSTLEGEGRVVQSKDGSRTLWARTPAAVPVDQPAVTTVDSEATADVETIAGDVIAEAAPTPAAPIPALHNVINWEKGTRAELVQYARALQIATNPKNTKTQLVELIANRLAERAQQARDAARPDFAGMKVAELKTQAKALGVTGTVSKMARADLITACDAAWDARQDEAAAEPAVETPAGGAESAVETPAPVDGPWGGGEPIDAPMGSVDAVLADLQAARPVSAPPAQTPAARRPRSGASDGTYRSAGGVVSAGLAPAWARGQCEATLLAMMQVLPDDEHSATSLVKAYNSRRADGQPIMQPGSTAFALDAMVKKGTARLTQDKPKRYAAAVVPIVQA